MRPKLTKTIPSEQPNIIEDDDGNSPTGFQRNVHMYLSGTKIIIPDFAVPPSRVRPAQPPRVDTGGPSSNLRSSRKKNPVPNVALAAQYQQVREANAVTHQIFGVAQEYRHMIKGPGRKFWELSFANEIGQLAQGIRALKETNTVILISKTQVPKDKKSHMAK